MLAAAAALLSCWAGGDAAESQALLRLLSGVGILKHALVNCGQKTGDTGQQMFCSKSAKIIQ